TGRNRLVHRPGKSPLAARDGTSGNDSIAGRGFRSSPGSRGTRAATPCPVPVVARSMESASGRFGGMIRAEMLHATTIALGACLLFLIQPLLGRQLLPWMGGSAGVWSACLVAFQFALLAGYVYADQLTRRFSAIVQRRVHLAIAAVSLLFLPIVTQSLFSRPAANLPPTLAIVVWILVSAGLPLLLLCASSPL